MAERTKTPILLVDDNERQREQLATLLLLKRFESDGVGSVEEAEAWIGERALGGQALPEVVIIDQQLHRGASGVVLTRWLKANHPDIHVILFSGQANVTERAMRMAGADRVLTKGGSVEMLLDMVQELVEEDKVEASEGLTNRTLHLLQSILEPLPVGITLVDQEDRILYANEESRRYLQLPEPESDKRRENYLGKVGALDEEVEWQEEIQDRVQSLFRSVETRRDPVRFYTQRSGEGHRLHQLLPLYLDGQRVVVDSMTDVTRIRQLAERLKELTDLGREVEEAWRRRMGGEREGEQGTREAGGHSLSKFIARYLCIVKTLFDDLGYCGRVYAWDGEALVSVYEFGDYSPGIPTRWPIKDYPELMELMQAPSGQVVVRGEDGAEALKNLRWLPLWEAAPGPRLLGGINLRMPGDEGRPSRLQLDLAQLGGGVAAAVLLKMRADYLDYSRARALRVVDRIVDRDAQVGRRATLRDLGRYLRRYLKPAGLPELFYRSGEGLWFQVEAGGQESEIPVEVKGCPGFQTAEVSGRATLVESETSLSGMGRWLKGAVRAWPTLTRVPQGEEGGPALLIPLMAGEIAVGMMRLLPPEGLDEPGEPSTTWLLQRQVGQLLNVDVLLIQAVSSRLSSLAQTWIAVERLRDRTRQAEENLRRSLVGVALVHDVNNKLSTLKMLALRMDEERLDARDITRRRELLSQIDETALWLRARLTLMAKQRTVSEPAPLDVALARLRSSPELRGLSIPIQWEVTPEVAGFEVPVEDLGVVLKNLLQNSARALEERGIKDAISVVAEKQECFLEIRVKDNAGGLPEEVLDKFGEPFVTTHVDGEGHGLGLFVARELLRTYGGDLVPGEAGIGVMTVLLPLHHETP